MFPCGWRAATLSPLSSGFPAACVFGSVFPLMPSAGMSAPGVVVLLGWPAVPRVLPVPGSGCLLQRGLSPPIYLATLTLQLLQKGLDQKPQPKATDWSPGMPERAF